MLARPEFWTILGAFLTIFVTLIIAILKFGRDTVTKDDLNNKIESLLSAINQRFEAIDRQFEEINRRLDEAATDRKEIKEEAATDREKIRIEMSAGFANAHDERKDIEEVARDDRKEIKGELKRQNQNYIEHLAHHNPPKVSPVSEEDDST